MSDILRENLVQRAYSRVHNAKDPEEALSALEVLYEAGYEKGEEAGYQDGYDDGRSHGYDDGYEDGEQGVTP